LGAKFNLVRINNMSIFEFAIYFDKKQHFDMLMSYIDDKKIIHPKESALLPRLVKKFIYDKQLVNRIRLALKQGVNINAKNDANATALLIAAYRTNFEAVKYLVEHGADVNITNKNGNTPIGIVGWKTGNLEIMNYLIEHGADINLTNNNGDSPLGLLVWDTNNLEAIKCLVEQKADVNIANNNGDTPLMDAAYLGKTKILSYLLSNGSDSNLKNKKSKTALDLARLQNKQVAIEILESHIN